MKFYGKKRIIISITLSVVVFFLVGSIMVNYENK